MDILKRAMCSLEYVDSHLLSPYTNMIYDHCVNKNIEQWPTYSECLSSFPNASGHGTGMEDSMISGGTMLDGCILLYELTGSTKAKEMAKTIVKGMLDAADTAKSSGFIPRSVSPSDGRSHYIDTSVDQYTLFIFGMHRYYNSTLCNDEERRRIADIAIKIADRAKRNVTLENNYDMLREDGGPTIYTKLWGSEIGNHVMMRLPMIYMFAWETSGDDYYFKLYRNIRQKAVDNSLPMTEYWHLYALHQMQLSVKLCYDTEPDDKWKNKLLHLMRQVDLYTLSKTEFLRNSLKDKSAYNMPQQPFRDCPMRISQAHKANGMPCSEPYRPDSNDYWTLQDMAIVTIVHCIVPGSVPDENSYALLNDAFDKIDFNVHQRSLPVHFFDAYCRLMNISKIEY